VPNEPAERIGKTGDGVDVRVGDIVYYVQHATFAHDNAPETLIVGKRIIAISPSGSLAVGWSINAKKNRMPNYGGGGGYDFTGLFSTAEACRAQAVGRTRSKIADLELQLQKANSELGRFLDAPVREPSA
jgi:hypothetical protein